MDGWMFNDEIAREREQDVAHSFDEWMDEISIFRLLRDVVFSRSIYLSIYPSIAERGGSSDAMQCNS